MSDNSLAQALDYFVRTFIRMAILFISISFLVGLMREYIPESTINRVLSGRRRITGNITGAAFGSITPFCACAGIPVLVGLLKAGVPFSSAIAFALASPLINPVIIGLMAVLFGWQIAVIYLAVAFVMAVVLGNVWERMGLAKYVKNVRVVGREETQGDNGSLKSRLSRATAGVWSQIRQIWPHLLIGVAIGAIIRGFIPTEWISNVAGSQNPLAIPVAAAIGGPIYIRTSTAIPICYSLLEKSMGLGAVMALLIGAAGTSIPSLGIMSSIFKPRLLVMFLLTIIVIATVAGYIFQIYAMIQA